MRVTPALRLQASRLLRSGHLDPQHGVYLGTWGELGSQPQKGIVTYSLSSNQQRPLAGTARAAVFNTFRRTSHQIFYWLPPLLVGYAAMEWATEKNEYLNSKPGRQELEALEAAGEA
ncbi:hypothetical protein DV737_g5760, partial [Chaetothyriales sp. CBS 132003]